MPGEKWLIDVAELDEFQIGIMELNLDDSYIIKGCAGSGKTILALYRAHDIRIDAKASGRSESFTVLVYTKVLRSFIKTAILRLGLSLNQVVHYDQWDGNPVDYIVIDEAQDFRAEHIKEFFEKKGKSVMLYGDSHQLLYNWGTPLEKVADEFALPQKELLKNYRLPKTIAEFALYLGDDKDLANKCVKAGTEKPKIFKFDQWQKELDFIMEEIKTRNYTDVAILLPFNSHEQTTSSNVHRNVAQVQQYFNENAFFCEYKMRTDEDDTIDLDFDSELPKVMPYHSSKGLQFETVFIPFIDCPSPDPWFVERFKTPLYVALTRTYKNLYLTYSQTINELFRVIPPTKYEFRK